MMVKENLENNNWTRGFWRRSTPDEIIKMVSLGALVREVQLADGGKMKLYEGETGKHRFFTWLLEQEKFLRQINSSQEIGRVIRHVHYVTRGRKRRTTFVSVVYLRRRYGYW